MGLKMKVIVVLVALVVAFLVGCTTFGDIRKSEPVKSVFVIDGSPQKLANCASYELSDNFNSTNPIRILLMLCPSSAIRRSRGVNCLVMAV